MHLSLSLIVISKRRDYARICESGELHDRGPSTVYRVVYDVELTTN